MFWDEKCPITTNYLTWFDDDTWSVTPRWIDDLCETIIANHHYNYRMFGTLMSHDLAIYKNTQLSASWFKRAQWYKGRNLRVRGQKAEAPNGSVIDFAVGWCWALEVAATPQPQPRLVPTSSSAPTVLYSPRRSFTTRS